MRWWLLVFVNAYFFAWEDDEDLIWWEGKYPVVV
jgi:hypothetical protein